MFKTLKNNKKGFTLIELLAVIVILAILVIVAIPMVTKYLDFSRKNAFASTASEIINAVADDCVMQNKDTCTYTTVAEVNATLRQPLGDAPFSGTKFAVHITVQTSTGKVTGYIAASANGTAAENDRCFDVSKDFTADNIMKLESVGSGFVCGTTKYYPAS